MNIDEMKKENKILEDKLYEAMSHSPVAYVKGCSVAWIQPIAGLLKDRQPLYARSITVSESDKKLLRALEFAEYMAKKAEEYIEEYSLLEEERLAQNFNNKKDNEKLFQMEQDLGETATQLKIYIYEFRKRNNTKCPM